MLIWGKGCDVFRILFIQKTPPYPHLTAVCALFTLDLPLPSLLASLWAPRLWKGQSICYRNSARPLICWVTLNLFTFCLSSIFLVCKDDDTYLAGMPWKVNGIGYMKCPTPDLARESHYIHAGSSKVFSKAMFEAAALRMSGARRNLEAWDALLSGLGCGRWWCAEFLPFASCDWISSWIPGWLVASSCQKSGLSRYT